MPIDITPDIAHLVGLQPLDRDGWTKSRLHHTLLAHPGDADEVLVVVAEGMHEVIEERDTYRRLYLLAVAMRQDQEREAAARRERERRAS